VLRTRSFILGLALIGLCAATPKAKAENAWLGLVAGPPAGSETVLAADMASLFEKDQGFRVLPMLGDAGAGNIALLLSDPRVDIAFVSTDALAAAIAAGQNLTERLELVARLAPQEIHVLARAEIGSLSDLARKKVNFGPEGGSSAATAAALFKALGITVEEQSLDAGAAIERLKQGTIAAAVIVGGKPYPLVSAVPANSGIHLLPIALARRQREEGTKEGLASSFESGAPEGTGARIAWGTGA
jgi:TRAP transporter TAXI family solute receptor